MSQHVAESVDADATHCVYRLSEIVTYALRLGTIGFGGPVALVGYMHRDLVERRQWISEADYKEGLTLAQLMPGPLAAQLAMYLGYVHYGVLGATLVGIAFVLPSFLMVVALGWAYVTYGGLAWMQAVFYGVRASVIVLGRRTIFSNGYTPDVFKVILLAITVGLLWKFKKLPEPVIVLGAALIGVGVYPLVSH